MYEKYGYYKDEVKSIGKGIEDWQRSEIMEYRAHTPSDFAGHKVLAVPRLQGRYRQIWQPAR